MAPVIGIVDVQRGNARSIALALQRVTPNVEVVRSGSQARSCDALVLPGVGNFGAFVEHLERHGFGSQMLQAFVGQRPLLGICVGMQYLSEGSDESQSSVGLSRFQTRTQELRNLGVTTSRVPHVGWATVEPSKSVRPPNWMSIAWGRDFYFMHSYAIPASEAGVVGTTIYESQLAAIVHEELITGVQFHPERSQDAGSDFLSGWVSSI